MTNRRDHQRRMAGVVFLRLRLLQPRMPTRKLVKRREVVVGGRRVKTIDVHAHCVFPRSLT